MAKVIVFGIKDLAELAHYYLETDSIHEVVAFTVNRSYLPVKKKFKGLPIIPFEDIEKDYNPNGYKFFAPMTHSNINKDREKVFNCIKYKGYQLISFIHKSAIVSKNAVIDENCFILENVIIQPFVMIGKNNIIWSNSTICHHSIIESNVFIAPSVSISGNCLIKSNTFLGIGSIVRDGIKIANGSYISLGSHVIENTESWSLYKGNPAAKVKDFNKKHSL